MDGIFSLSPCVMGWGWEGLEPLLGERKSCSWGDGYPLSTALPPDTIAFKGQKVNPRTKVWKGEVICDNPDKRWLIASTHCKSWQSEECSLQRWEGFLGVSWSCLVDKFGYGVGRSTGEILSQKWEVRFHFRSSQTIRSRLCFLWASISLALDLRRFTKALDDLPIWKHFFHQTETSPTALFWWFTSVDLRWFAVRRRQHTTVHEITNNYRCTTIQFSRIHLVDILESTPGYSCQNCI